MQDLKVVTEKGGSRRYGPTIRLSVRTFGDTEMYGVLH
jgi:hypothetical protein